VRIVEFAKKYGLHKDSVSIFLKNHPEFAIKKERYNEVNAEELEKRLELKESLWHYCTEIYYPLVEEVFESEWKLSKRLAMETRTTASNWFIFINETLWNIPSFNILDVKISKKQLIFAMKGTKYLWLYYTKEKDKE